jgi:hypothetical protein
LTATSLKKIRAEKSVVASTLKDEIVNESQRFVQTTSARYAAAYLDHL